MNKEFCVLFCTASVDESDKIAKMLVEERLAACVNITAVQSHYRWQGELCEDSEALLIIKTGKSRVDKIIKRIKDMHSYDVPEIIALPIVAGYDKYLEWVDKSVG